jgi:general secretion pathway protein I
MRRPEGFTLIEVLIALAIAALGIASLIAATGTGLGNVDVAARVIEATRRAQSRLAAVGISAPLLPGELSGSDGDDYAWTTRISSPLIHTAVAGADPTPALFEVEVEISWYDGPRRRSVSLRSERLAAAVPSSHD